MKIGNYGITIDVEIKTFFIKKKTPQGDETIRVTHHNQFLILTHRCGDVVRFKRAKHRGKWCWNDGRIGKLVTDEQFELELARMLFNGKVELTRQFLFMFHLEQAALLKKDDYGCCPADR